MRILIVSQYYYPENFVITKIAETWVKMGHEVCVVTGKPNYGFGQILPAYKKVKFEIINGVRVFRVPLFAKKKSKFRISLNYLSYWANAKRFLAHFDEKFDVVFSMSLSPVISIAPAIKYAKKHQIPHFLYCVDLWPESVAVTDAIPKKSIFFKILYKWSVALYKKCDHIYLSSPSFAEYFREVLKLPDVPTSLLYQPSLVTDYQGDPFQFDDDKFHILYCGNLGRIQLVETMVEAAKILKARNANIVLDIIGMGSEGDKMLENIKTHDLHNVNYLGPVPPQEAAKYFKAASALFVSLKNEGYVGKTIPNRVSMCMALQKPIVGLVGGDTFQLLEKTQGTDLLLQENDPVLLANLWEKMAKMPAKTLQNYGILNKKFYDQNFSLDNLCQKIINDFETFRRNQDALES